MTKPVEIYQIKVTLRDSQSPIWRRIQVSSNIALAKFHRILQRAMGWEDAHLHRFSIHGRYYGIPHREKGLRTTKDERDYRLSDVVPRERSQFTYLYDFGDNWEHVLVVEKTLSLREGARYPVCLAGARACPPEDVGGIPGYEDFLEAVKNPDHPEYDEYIEWIGGNFDPEAFDVDEVNQRLRALR
ncbi:MAG: plasmid pRiA4b ORF-3 family protein [Candidatus Acidiferrales bacterium]